ncbi:MAG: nickel pincer cofactor biosynthesis protein LarC [Sporolactobacillus sp.]
MKTLYLDCFSGISGDMLLGLLLDLGLKPSELTSELAKLHVDGYSIDVKQKMTHGISATDVTVTLEHPEFTHHDNELHHHRNLADCQSIINTSTLSNWVKLHANQVFEEVAQAEAHVHGKSIEDVHFHEVGAIDSIIDIVGTCIGLESLGIEKVYASPLHDGRGWITCAHGKMPVPVPAVAQMLVDTEIPYVQEDIPTELITPTGMALIKTFASGFGQRPAMRVLKIGYGTGKRETGRMNALRGLLGQQNSSSIDSDEIAVMEANIDDQTGEQLGYVMQRLIHEGALDVYYTPIYMKKNRPANQLTVLAKSADQDVLAALIFAETSTLGIRINRCPRLIMTRELKTIQTVYGRIHIKHARWGDIEKWAPEFEDCAFLAQEHQIPLHKVYEEAENSLHLLLIEQNVQAIHSNRH